MTRSRESAVGLSLMIKEQLAEVISEIDQYHIHFGQALVAVEAIDQETMEDRLAEYKRLCMEDDPRVLID